MISGDPHQHKKSHGVLDKISNKISSIKEDITESARERSHSSSSDRRGSISSTSTTTSISSGGISPPSDAPILLDETIRSHKTSIDSASSASLSTPAALARLSPNRHTHSIDQLALNMGFGKGASALPIPVPVPTAPSSVLINSAATVPTPVITHSDSQVKFVSDEDIVWTKDDSSEVANDTKEYVINKVDPIDMTATPTAVTVPKDTVRRSAMLLAGSKFRLNTVELPKDKFIINSDTILPASIIIGVVSLILTLWKPISSYFSGFIVGFLFAATIVYVLIRIYINTLTDANVIEERIDFPALESMLEKVDKEDKNTNLHVSGASVTFQRYDADRDDDFVRYPCDIRLDGYRLIIKLASKHWNEEKKSVKFIGYREYLVKEAKLILVPEATLTRGKYWMNDYPIVIQDLQILDKQILSKQQMEKSKLDANDFFNNNSTILSIWLETGPQKEEWFHKLSLILRKGKEEIDRANSLILGGGSPPPSPPMTTSSLNYRAAQNENDTEFSQGPVSEVDIRAAIVETQSNAQELQQQAQSKTPTDDDKDTSGTHRTAARKSKKTKPNEASLYKVLQAPECLDEAAITINFMTRRLLCDIFEISFFKDMLKTKIEMKMKEVAVSILENLRVVSMDMGNTFPVILKIEPMQWNTNGIWFNLFLFYRGSFKLSVKTRLVLQKLINYDPKKDKPIFAQHHTAQLVHKDDERIDEDDLVQRQKLLAKEPEIPEMAVARKLGTMLTNLATNKYFQMLANLPFVTKLFEKLSEEEVGADVEVTSFSGLLTLNIPPPPSDRIWVGFPEMPDLNIKVTPTYGNKQYSYKLLQDLLAAKVRAELKRLIVLPAMDDQLLPLFRDWAIDVIGEIVAKPVNPLTDNYKAKLNAQTSVREGLQEYKDAKDLNKPGASASSSSLNTYL